MHAQKQGHESRDAGQPVKRLYEELGKKINREYIRGKSSDVKTPEIQEEVA